MRKLLTWYSLYFNRRYRRTGHLFENRYKSTICNEDDYLRALIRYIHFNILRAKKVAAIDHRQRLQLFFLLQGAFGPYHCHQPHGFGPTRFPKEENLDTFRSGFRMNDSFYLLPIYYAGGTSQKNISSEKVINELGEQAFFAQAVKDRAELLAPFTGRCAARRLCSGHGESLAVCTGSASSETVWWGKPFLLNS